MKYELNLDWILEKLSHPTRGGWIEIFEQVQSVIAEAESHPTRGGWIEIARLRAAYPEPLSHPTRGGWIEILGDVDMETASMVPPHAGWVD